MWDPHGVVQSELGKTSCPHTGPPLGLRHQHPPLGCVAAVCMWGGGAS